MVYSKAKLWSNLILICLVLNLACKNETTDWEKAKETGNIDAYKDYLTNYPAGRYVDTAKAKIDSLQTEIAWQSAEKAGTIEALEVFLEQHPQNRFSSKARALLNPMLEERAWQRVLKSVTSEALQSFIKEFGRSSHLPEARKRLIQAIWQENANKSNKRAISQINLSVESTVSWLRKRGFSEETLSQLHPDFPQEYLLILNVKLKKDKGPPTINLKSIYRPSAFSKATVQLRREIHDLSIVGVYLSQKLVPNYMEVGFNENGPIVAWFISDSTPEGALSVGNVVFNLKDIF